MVRSLNSNVSSPRGPNPVVYHVPADDNVQMNPENRAVLPPIAFRSFAQSYVAPELSEGFEDITTVNFEVSDFALIRLKKKPANALVQFEGPDAEREVWSKYWVSKYST